MNNENSWMTYGIPQWSGTYPVALEAEMQYVLYA